MRQGRLGQQRGSDEWELRKWLMVQGLGFGVKREEVEDGCESRE